MTSNGMCWPDDEDEVVRPAGELPVAVQMEWTRAWDRETANSYNEPVYRVTWADGAVEIRHSIRNEWHAIKPLGSDEALDETLANLAAGDEHFRPISAPHTDIIRTVRRVA